MGFVVDTSIFLSDPKFLDKVEAEDIVIPLAVLVELEAKRIHPELGYAAREALRKLEFYRIQGNLTAGVSTPAGGSIRIELNNIHDSDLPASFRESTADNKILAVAKNLGDHTLLTKDLPLRLKASIVGVESSDFSEDAKDEGGWPSIVHLAVTGADIDNIYRDKILDTDVSDYDVNTCFILQGSGQSALARLHQDGKLHLVRDKKVFDVRGRSAEQRFAIDFLTDDSVGIVSLGGSAGTGKSILALAAGFDSVLELRKHKRVVVFRPMYAVGNQDLGFLPGTAEEKMSPWAAAVFDALEVFCGENVIDTIIEDELLEVLPLTHIRGRTLTDSFVIIDEAQNLEKMVLLTALSRIGNNSKIVLTHDIAQRDNLRVGKYDGIASAVTSLSGDPLFSHITLTKSERSPIAELVTRVLGQ